MSITQEKAIKLIRNSYPYLKESFGVERVGLFGSLAHGTATAESDVDLIVELEKPLGYEFIDLVDYFEQLLGTDVDVLTQSGLKNMRVASVKAEIKNSVIYV